MTTPDNFAKEIPEECVCPVCASIITNEEEQEKCENCSTIHHSDCWKYGGGCAIFGCKKGATWQPADSNKPGSNFADVNLYLIHTWSWLFHVHWLTFVITGYGLTVLTCVALLYQVVYTVFDVLATSGATATVQSVGIYTVLWKLCNFVNVKS